MTLYLYAYTIILPTLWIACTKPATAELVDARLRVIYIGLERMDCRVVDLYVRLSWSLGSKKNDVCRVCRKLYVIELPVSATIGLLA